ncbi:DUF4124 domain-containing protein [Microbulbifer sp. SAOS-129_SWC]|uniref:DUF4124 domain-containing protein n=1 Tax=Microbulbifer sp. SAOS-129_SWC TaxID=3145235 RepID=UPI0032177C7F
MNATRICAALLLAVAMTAAADGGLYRWVDADGQVHYSDQPPPQGKAENVAGALRPINSADATQVQRTHHSQQDSVQQQYEARKQQQARQHQRQMASACRRARRDLHLLQGRVAFIDESGKEVKITERERQQRAAALQQQIARVCG